MSKPSESFEYLQLYKKEIADGKYIVGQWMRLNLELVTKTLDEKECFYDPTKAQNAIDFIEKYLRFVQGRDALFKLETWQKYITACIFGLVDSDGSRHFTEFVWVC